MYSYLTKKKEFNKPSLNIFNYSNLNLTKILQSEGTNLKINNKLFLVNLKMNILIL